MADTPKPAGRPQGRSSTHTGSKGQVISLDDPIDKGYLCSRICLCNAGTKLRDRLGRELKQRCTTVSIWDDEDKNQLVWRYKAEVGYSMKANPPAPLMSREQPNRASRFPLGRAIGDGLLKGQLEGRPQKGLLRIPDCIVLKATGVELASMRSAGHIDWKRLIPVQSNIETVVEIKFDGDELSNQQILAYRKIAGTVDRFRLLKASDCDCDHRRPDPATEPVRVPVTTPMKRESTAERRWYVTAPPVPAPQPVKPSYGPVASDAEGASLSSYLKSVRRRRRRRSGWRGYRGFVFQRRAFCSSKRSRGHSWSGIDCNRCYLAHISERFEKGRWCMTTLEELENLVSDYQ